jgi:formylglycine-generating enzyme required for sulfatase activity
MIVVPAGEYAMGSPADEANRDPREDPRHRVRIGYSFAVGKYPITVGEFAHFVAATGYDAGDWCHTDEAGAQPKTGRNWRTPGFDQTDANPVVCVSALDAQAYIDWLSRTTGHHYRLMSEAEYEYVNRAGTVSAFWWGDDANAACAYANGPDLDTQAVFPSWAANACHDGYAFTAPVGRFKANAFGLYDTTGNAWSWLADCYTDSYVGAPTDGSANLGGDCKWHMLRGGAWGRAASYLRSARRGRDLVGNRIYNNSFRVARTL